MSRTYHASKDARRTDRANRRIVRLSYSTPPRRILFGPNAGELARVGLDERGQFIIVPVSQILGRVER